MMARPRILVFASVYEPGFMAGGPVRSIANMVERLGDQFAFRIVTADRDRGSKEAYDGIQTGAWRRRGSASVLYLKPSQLNAARMTKLLAGTPHDLIYLNSFFDPRFTTLPLLVRRFSARRSPILLAPRGEFAAGALALKPVKKQLFLSISKVLRLYHNLIWQASTGAEARDIKRALPGLAADIRIAPDLLADDAAVSTLWQPRQRGEPLRIVFLSRIAPVKNLSFALEALRGVTVPVRFSIHGPCTDPAYWRACQALIATLPDHVEVRRMGPVLPDEVGMVLSQNDLLLLPTLGENFGHVIVEALRAGTPALISDRTPWRGLAEACAGADLPLEHPAAFIAFIEKMARQTPGAVARMRKQTTAFIRSALNDDAAIAANQALFQAALSRGQGRQVA